MTIKAKKKEAVSMKKKTLKDLVRDGIKEGSMLLMVGLPATGKSTVAKYIADSINFKILRTDMIRKELMDEKDLFDKEKAGSMESRRKIYQELFDRANDLIKDIKKKNSLISQKGSLDSEMKESFSKYNGIILDATFVKKDLREKAINIAADVGVSLYIVQTTCEEKIAVNRIESRTKEDYESNALSADIYFINKKLFDPVKIEEIHSKYPNLDVSFLVVDTSDCEPQECLVSLTK